jgi:excisionase family DNA binding protein
VDRHRPIDANALQATVKGADTSLLLDIKDAGRFLGLSSWQVRALISDGSLPIVKVGRKFYFRRTTLVRWAERAEERAA